MQQAMQCKLTKICPTLWRKQQAADKRIEQSRCREHKSSMIQNMSNCTSSKLPRCRSSSVSKAVYCPKSWPNLATSSIEIPGHPVTVLRGRIPFGSQWLFLFQKHVSNASVQNMTFLSVFQRNVHAITYAPFLRCQSPRTKMFYGRKSAKHVI
jgi:hypothetical protein